MSLSSVKTKQVLADVELNNPVFSKDMNTIYIIVI